MSGGNGEETARAFAESEGQVAEELPASGLEWREATNLRHRPRPALHHSGANRCAVSYALCERGASC